MTKKLLYCLIAGLVTTSCDHGLAPVDEEGEIHVTITYEGEWPPDDEIYELRFVAMRFIPGSTSDFLRLNEMEVSDRLKTQVDQQSIILEEVRNGRFFYSGVAWQFSPNIFQDWRVLGLYKEGNGEFNVRGDVVEIHVNVDFDDLPEFPPES